MSGMRLLSIVSLLACINVATAASASKEVKVQTHSDNNNVILSHSLRTGERKLAVNLPGLGQAVTSSKSWASNLMQKLQLKWWQLKKKSPNDVFTKLKLEQTSGNLFKSPSFTKWASYVTKNSKEDPEMAIFSTLAYHYDDEVLLKMFRAAKSVDSTKVLATKLEGILLSYWAKTPKNPNQFFVSLGLDQAGAKVFRSPQFSKWTDYITKANPKNPDVAIYATLGTHYSDDALAKMLQAAKEVDSTNSLATKLEGIQLNRWENAGKSADDVFKTLKLDQAGGDKLFENPAVSTWATYVTKTQKNPDTVMVATLKESFGDAALAKLLAATIHTDPGADRLATDLRSVQFKSWFTQGRTPDHVDTLLSVSANSDDLTKTVARDYSIFYGKIEAPAKVKVKYPGNGRTGGTGEYRPITING